MRISMMAVLCVLPLVSVSASELHDAIQKKDLEAVKKLLAAKPDLRDEKDDPLPLSPLQHAAMVGAGEIAEFLISKGADLHSDEQTMSLLAAAAAGGSKELVAMLLDKGMDVGWRGEGSMTVLCFAKTPEIAALLLEKGAKLEAVVKGGKSPLQWQAENGNAEVIKLLLSKGAAINATDQMGMTALHDAAMAGSKEAAAVLLEHGADPNVRMVTGVTPLDVALSLSKEKFSKIGDPDGVAKLLREKGGKTAKELGPAVSSIDTGGDKELAEKLSSKDATVRLEVLKSLAGAKAELAAPAIVLCLRDADERVRSAAVDALKKLGTKAIPVLAQALEPPPSNDVIGVGGTRTRETADEPPSDIPALVNLLKDPTKRSAAIIALGKLGPRAKDAVPALIALIPESKFGVLGAIAKALGEIGPDAKAAIPSLVPLLTYDKTVDQTNKKVLINARFVVGYAAYAIINIDPTVEQAGDAAKVITHDLTFQDFNDRHAKALEALQKLGERALPAMIEAYQNGDGTKH